MPRRRCDLVKKVPQRASERTAYHTLPGEQKAWLPPPKEQVDSACDPVRVETEIESRTDGFTGCTDLRVDRCAFSGCRIARRAASAAVQD